MRAQGKSPPISGEPLTPNRSRVKGLRVKGLWGAVSEVSCKTSHAYKVGWETPSPFNSIDELFASGNHS